MANLLVFGYMKNGHYDNILWETEAGAIDQGYVALVNQEVTTLEALYDTETGIEMDVPHWAASTNAYYYLADPSLQAEFGGWAGDLLTITGDSVDGFNAGTYPSVYDAAKDLIGNPTKGSFGQQDVLADVDAGNFATILKANPTLPIDEVIRGYYVNYTNRYDLFVTNRFETADNLYVQGELILNSNLPLNYFKGNCSKAITRSV